MSSSRGGGNPKGKHVSEVISPKVEQLSQDIGQINLGSTEDDGNWEEVINRKTKNRAGSTTAKPWGSPSSTSKSWGQQEAQKPTMQSFGGSGRAPGNSWASQTADYRKPAGRGNGRQQSTARNYDNRSVAPQHPIPPPLDHGWNWQSRAGFTQPKGPEDNKDNYAPSVDDDKDEISDADAGGESDFDDDDDDLSDEFDSDASVKSHGTRKKNRLLKKFFEDLDSLTIEEINELGRQWHCPACQNGPGAIDWYRGLQPLMTHAKTKGSIRARLHRELAELLDEELRRRGTTVVPAGESFGKWKGLTVEEKDHEIVWPPMVIIMNTRHEQDENDKWIGMGNQELLDYFSSYAAERARHSYGPHGHRGMSLLIFESSARGYFEAERLHRHFVEQRTDRDAWDRSSRVLFHPGGQRQLYGYMAMKDDMDLFNQHSQGKSRLKFEMRSYQEKVVNDLRQMSEDNQQLIWLKNRVVKEQRHAKALEESLGIVSEKLRQTTKDNRIVIQRTQTQQQETQEEMLAQEEFFQKQMKTLHDSRDAKEEGFERLQQEQREKVKQSDGQPSLDRSVEIANFIKVQDKEIEEFVTKRDMLIKVHGENKAAMKRRHWEEEVALEKDFNDKLTQLMDKYSKVQPEAALNSEGVKYN